MEHASGVKRYMHDLRTMAAAFSVGIAVTLLGSHAVRADPTSPVSLREAILYARAHQPSIAAARARVDVALATAEIPHAAYGGRVAGAAELLAGTANNTTASYATIGILDVGRVGGTPANQAVSWSPEPSTIIGVAAHKELYDFGRLEAQAESLDALARAAGEDAKTAQLDLDLYVEESFYAVLGAKQVLAASDAAVTRSSTHRDFAQARVTAQLMPPIELTRAEADLARYEVDKIRAQGSLSVAQAVLAAAIGANVPTIDAGVDDLALPEAPPAATAVQEMQQRAPELRAARAQVLAQQKQTTAIQAELHPDFSVSAEVTGRAGGAAVTTNPTPTGAGWLPDVPNWDALVVFSWPIFDRVVDTRARASQRQEAVREAELAQVSEELRTTAQRAYVDLDVTRAALPALQRAVDSAQANHDQAEARFNGGLGNAVELSDAEALLTDAQIQAAVGQFQLSRARARIARVLAESIP
jgi:outer membrane protein TolC